MPKKTDWKEALGYNTIKAVPSKVNGEDQSFWPISVAMAFELRGLAKPISKAIAGLFGSNAQNVGNTFRNIKNTAQNGTQEIVEQTVTAIDPALADTRNKQTSEAIETLFEAFSARETQEVVAKLVMDSLRDVFDRTDTPGQGVTFDVSPRDFLQGTPLPVMREYAIGLFMANRKVLGPFADLVEGKITDALSTKPATKPNLQPDALNQTQNEPQPPSESPPSETPPPAPVTG